jgi:hypothetical protein
MRFDPEVYAVGQTYRPGLGCSLAIADDLNSKSHQCILFEPLADVNPVNDTPDSKS